MTNQMKHQEVVSKLIEDGYYIIHENLEVRYLNSAICKFNIVGMNFILDVKTSLINNNSGSRINSLLYVRHLLPEGYKYILYSSLFTEDEIKELKDTYTSPSYIFINDLEKIKEYVSPMKNVECNTTRDLRNLLWITDDEMNKINTIYVPYDIYKKCYETLTLLRDIPENNTLMYTEKINRIESLIRENKLVFDKSHLENVFPFTSRKKKYIRLKYINLKSLDKIVFNQIYYNMCFKSAIRL